jgi:hypothetical protein
MPISKLRVVAIAALSALSLSTFEAMAQSARESGEFDNRMTECVNEEFECSNRTNLRDTNLVLSPWGLEREDMHKIYEVPSRPRKAYVVDTFEKVIISTISKPQKTVYVQQTQRPRETKENLWQYIERR